MFLGKHITVDMFDVDMETLNNINSNMERLEIWDQFIKDTFTDANITLLNTSWHNFDKKGAFTVLYLLAESHLSIHTWPEHKYIALDVFTCGNSNTELVVDKVVQYFQPKRIKKNILSRGEVEKNKLLTIDY
jgi:S-adenosylmethionine decarboxylase proenzyme